MTYRFKSPPSRGRGSKRHPAPVQPLAGCRPLRGGVDRNHDNIANMTHDVTSPPSRGRGSKPVGVAGGAVRVCRPLRGGVDRNCQLSVTGTGVIEPVAPFAGAWIETRHASQHRSRNQCRPLRGGVDRNIPLARRSSSVRMSPPSRGRGSKLHEAVAQKILHGRPLRGGVDRNSAAVSLIWIACSRPLRGGVDRNREPPSLHPLQLVAPFAGAWIETAHGRLSQVAGGSPPSRGRGSKHRRRAARHG